MVRPARKWGDQLQMRREREVGRGKRGREREGGEREGVREELEGWEGGRRMEREKEGETEVQIFSV